MNFNRNVDSVSWPGYSFMTFPLDVEIDSNSNTDADPSLSFCAEPVTPHTTPTQVHVSRVSRATAMRQHTPSITFLASHQLQLSPSSSASPSPEASARAAHAASHSQGLQRQKCLPIHAQSPSSASRKRETIENGSELATNNGYFSSGTSIYEGGKQVDCTSKNLDPTRIKPMAEQPNSGYHQNASAIFGVRDITTKNPITGPLLPLECFDVAAFGDIMGKGAVPPTDMSNIDSNMDEKNSKGCHLESARLFGDVPNADDARLNNVNILQRSMATLQFPVNPRIQICSSQQQQQNTTGGQTHELSTVDIQMDGCGAVLTKRNMSNVSLIHNQNRICKRRTNNYLKHFYGGKCENSCVRFATELSTNIHTQHRSRQPGNVFAQPSSQELQDQLLESSSTIPVLMQTPSKPLNTTSMLVQGSDQHRGSLPAPLTLFHGIASGSDQTPECNVVPMTPPESDFAFDNDSFLRGVYQAMLDAAAFGSGPNICDASADTPAHNSIHGIKEADGTSLIGGCEARTDDTDIGAAVEGDGEADGPTEKTFPGLGDNGWSSVRDQYDELPLDIRRLIDRLRARISKMPRRKLRECLASAVTLDEIEPLMGVNRDDLATMLSLGVTTWKSFVHQELGVSRWPARSLKSALAKRRDAMARLAAAEQDGREDDVAGLRTELARLDRARERMMDGLRQAARQRQEAIDAEKRQEEANAIFPALSKVSSDGAEGNVGADEHVCDGGEDECAEDELDG
jgi:hypothetical protein